MKPTTNAPEKIWANPLNDDWENDGGSWCLLDWQEEGDVEYIRTDLVLNEFGFSEPVYHDMIDLFVSALRLRYAQIDYMKVRKDKGIRDSYGQVVAKRAQELDASLENAKKYFKSVNCDLS